MTDGVPVSELAAYRKFRKSLYADMDAYIVLAAPGSAAVSQAWSNPAFRQAYLQAVSDWRRGDWSAVEDDIHRATEAAPNSEAAWMTAGSMYWWLRQTDKSEEAYRKAIALAPHDIKPYGQLSALLYALHGNAATLPVWSG